MKQIGVVATLFVVALLMPAMAFAQVTPSEPWCGGAHGPDGTNFGECPRAHGNPRIAGPASGLSGLERMNLYDTVSPDRLREIQAPGAD